MKLLAFILLITSVIGRVLEHGSSSDFVYLKNAALDCDIQRVNSWIDRYVPNTDERLLSMGEYVDDKRRRVSYFNQAFHDNALFTKALFSNDGNNKRDFSPLEAAVFRECIDVVDILVANGVVKGLLDIDKALLIVLEKVPPSRKFIQLLLRVKAEYSTAFQDSADGVSWIHYVRDEYGTIRYSIVGNESLIFFIKEGSCYRLLYLFTSHLCPPSLLLCVVVLIYAYGWDWVEQQFNLLQGRVKNMCLRYAVRYGSYQLVDVLLRAGASAWTRDYSGRPLLCVALVHNREDIMELLIEKIGRFRVFDLIVESDELLLTSGHSISSLLRAGALFDHRNTTLDRGDLLEINHEQSVSFIRQLLFDLASRGGLPNMRTPSLQYSRAQRGRMLPMKVIRADRILIEKLKKRQKKRTKGIYRSISNKLGGDTAHEILAFER